MLEFKKKMTLPQFTQFDSLQSFFNKMCWHNKLQSSLKIVIYNNFYLGYHSILYIKPFILLIIPIFLFTYSKMKLLHMYLKKMAICDHLVKVILEKAHIQGIP